ncbi:putative ABC transport system permease protein [Ekhidna lutea]|uniref:Putative ABC transport system permease protein n=1 Tax=Ekhidna lutea TaxID=447679 RepID=A0A239HUM1_EKHLU|nr:FtsX-like permease family protein [Ekhidna lutea]SNS84433.1 putative ABC transport system permease protein [Ekhidna lutea]
MDKQRKTPPSWSTKFLAWFLKEDYYEDVQGDLEEEFNQKAQGIGLLRAKRWYTLQILRLFKPDKVKKIEAQNSIEKETTMFKNYFKIGLRNLWKYKSSTVINVIGLSTGIAAFVLIALFVKDELSYDRHHEHAENIYRVTVKNYTTDGDISRQWAFASAGHAKLLKEDYAEITHSTRFYPWAFPDLEYQEQTFRGEPVIFCDPDAFEIFDFKFLAGSEESAFPDIYSLVLTRASAIKIFGNDWEEKNIIGETVSLSRDDNEAPFKVTAVIEDMPDQQHFHFDYLAPIRFVEMIMGEDAANNVGGNYNWMTFIRTNPEADIPKLTEAANDEFWDKYIGNFDSGSAARDFYDFEFQPLLDIHLKSNLEGEYETNGSIEQVYIFSVVGILLLLVACVNYMNIATSHYSRRMKEVGVRKVIGAFKSSLIKQFLSESLLVVIVSLPLAVLLILWALPYLNEFMEKQLSFNPLVQTDIFMGLILLMVLVGGLAGLYPAVFLSKINLVQALKGEQSMNSSKWNFRSFLVTFQYIVTIGLLFAIGVIESQMNFIQNSDPGFDRDYMVTLRLPRGDYSNETFRSELLKNPQIEKAAFSSRIPTGRLADNWGSRFYKGDSAIATSFRLPVVTVDKYFLDTYGIDILAGENFRDGMETDLVQDTMVTGYYIINLEACKALGFEDPAEIVGQKLGYGPSEGRIIGVMDDFHFESLHSPIVPTLFLTRDRYRRISLKIGAEDIRGTLDYIENIFAQFDPESDPNYRFVDDLFNDQYQKEERLGTMIKVFAVIAILIGCLGLIGMVGFIIETKLKEIGVRKVLGASTQNIWMIISNRFLILIAIAFIIGLPVAYWFMSDWLQGFVYRTNISFMLIAMPVVVATLLTLAAIAYQTLKATRVNPVECLKDE